MTHDQIVAAPDGDIYFLDDAFVRRVDLPGGTIHSVYEHTFPISQGGSANRWLAALVARKPKMVAAVALANKMARMIWAVTTKQEDYRMA